ncbi:head-tail adaptor protein [Pseudomonas quasicaspiana]|uniref:head-tail adaptor protein n=1 Tax=Pseudomonas quasicaspiana TaxID=2829821 RepID=UPI001E3C03A5|nr:head-tail adaptor protein [Pseudomonas quasicaspiana]MCD5980509.1 head-tail adaptor protein [Pseudomonas quasicaspiana]
MISPGAGTRDKRVILRTRNDKPANDADLQSDYVEVARRWAFLEPLGTLLVNSGIQTGDKITHRLIFSRVAGVDDRYEVVLGSRLFRVVRVADVNEAGVDTLLEVEEITGNPESAGSMLRGDPYE